MTSPDTIEPDDIIASRASGNIDDSQMLELLVAYGYTFDRFPDGGNPLVEAFEPGTWSQVRQAFYDGRLSDYEYRTIFRAHENELRGAS